MTTAGSGRLADKAALVTGASRGIGAAIAQRFAAEGARVVNASLIEPVYDAPAVTSIIGDVSDPEGAQHIVDEAADRLGKLDILVNNAGIELEATIEHTSPDEWDRIMAVNAKGPFLCSRFALPHLRRTRGVIVNTASVDAFWGEPELAAYCASKGAVLALTRCLALDHAKDGIRAVAICPGYVRTDLLEQFYDNQPDPEAARASLTRKHPLGRICEPAEVASLATWLASDEAAFVSGQPYVIDGALTAGRTFGWA
ncbi:MAG TPA: glucose 1-dehydrogenase [Thermoleophilaceae bacterium]|nr:glucose 1-dehydrogenase [Thermoleophilaceae bacterium]